jgi:hypothetical protein
MLLHRQIIEDGSHEPGLTMYETSECCDTKTMYLQAVLLTATSKDPGFWLSPRPGFGLLLNAHAADDVCFPPAHGPNRSFHGILSAFARQQRSLSLHARVCRHGTSRRDIRLTTNWNCGFYGPMHRCTNAARHSLRNPLARALPVEVSPIAQPFLCQSWSRSMVAEHGRGAWSRSMTDRTINYAASRFEPLYKTPASSSLHSCG